MQSIFIIDNYKNHENSFYFCFKKVLKILK